MCPGQAISVGTTVTPQCQHSGCEDEAVGAVTVSIYAIGEMRQPLCWTHLGKAVRMMQEFTMPGVLAAVADG
jgi:hypothetical protein